MTDNNVILIADKSGIIIGPWPRSICLILEKSELGWWVNEQIFQIFLGTGDFNDLRDSLKPIN